MAVLNPKLSFLDETDSGLDIDALKIVANGINKISSDDNAVVLVTHYQRILDYVTPDYVHVMIDGKIAKSGDKDLAIKLEDQGYDWLTETASV
jgi:Fe-S cluster assembly ATP-binding protein